MYWYGLQCACNLGKIYMCFSPMTELYTISTYPLIKPWLNLNKIMVISDHLYLLALGEFTTIYSFFLCLTSFPGLWAFPLCSPGDRPSVIQVSFLLSLKFGILSNIWLLLPGQADCKGDPIWSPDRVRTLSGFLLWLLSLTPGDYNQTVIFRSKCLVLNKMRFLCSLM